MSQLALNVGNGMFETYWVFIYGLCTLALWVEGHGIDAKWRIRNLWDGSGPLRDGKETHLTLVTIEPVPTHQAISGNCPFLTITTHYNESPNLLHQDQR